MCNVDDMSLATPKTDLLGFFLISGVMSLSFCKRNLIFFEKLILTSLSYPIHANDHRNLLKTKLS